MEEINPKEKANQLVQMMLGQMPNPDMSFSMAKEKCILFVNEIIMEIEAIEDFHSYGFSSDYWKEVQQEITNI